MAVDIEAYNNYPIATSRRFELGQRWPLSSPYVRALGSTAKLLSKAGKRVLPVIAASAAKKLKTGSISTPITYNSPAQMPYQKRKIMRRLRRRTGRRKSGSRMSGVNTFQHDSKGRYGYRRMPAGRRRKWKSFVRKVRHIELGQQPLQIYTNATASNGSTAANAQSYYGYIIGGTQVSGNDELYQTFQQAYNVANVAACVNYRIYIKNICTDYQFTNTGTYAIIVDVYHVVCRKVYNTANTLTQLISTAATEVASPSGGGSFSITNPSPTLFDVPNFLKYWKIKSKSEILLAAGNTFTLQLRKSLDKLIEGRLVVTCPQGIPGYSEGIVYMWRGTPRNTGTSGAAELSATTVTVSTQTVVHYAIPPGKTIESGKTT